MRKATGMSGCKITYISDTCPLPGEYVIPQGPRARTAYLVVASRKIQPRQPRNYQIWMLEVLRIGRIEVPPDAIWHPLYWLKRESKRRTFGWN